MKYINALKNKVAVLNMSCMQDTERYHETRISQNKTRMSPKVSRWVLRRVGGTVQHWESRGQGTFYEYIRHPQNLSEP